MDELMNNVREWLPSQEACSASRIQRKFRLSYADAAHVIRKLKIEARISEDWDVSIGGYVVLGRQSNNASSGLATTCAHEHVGWITNYCYDCNQVVEPANR